MTDRDRLAQLFHPMHVGTKWTDDNTCRICLDRADEAISDGWVRPQDADLLMEAWEVIANASDWNQPGQHGAEWTEAAERWRDKFHAVMFGREATDE